MPISVYIAIAVYALKKILPYLERAAGGTPSSTDDSIIRVVKDVIQLFEQGGPQRLLKS